MEETDYLAFRKRFPIFNSKVYLNSCSQGAISDAGEAAMQDYLDSWRSQGSPWEHWMEVQEELRQAFAAMIGALPEEIAITSSASAGIYSIASSLRYDERSSVVLGELEFPTQCYVWLAQQTRGAVIEWVPARDGAITADEYRTHLDSRTLIVPTTHVCFRNGYRQDVAGIAQAARKVGALFLLDDYQSCGTRPLDVKATGCDFYVTGTLKYLLAASGIAFLYVRKDLIEQLSPTLTGWFAQRNQFAFDIKHHDPALSANRFQHGTPPIPSIYSSLAGIQVLSEIGLANVEQRIAQLAELFIQKAGENGWKLKTPLDSRGPLVVLEVGNQEHAAALVAALGERGIIVSARDGGVRVSFHAYNSPQDVEAIVTALQTLLPH